MDRESFVQWCANDRDRLTEEFFIMRPDNEGTPAALWVEELLEVLGFKICYQPMAANQLGLYDAENGLIFINSKLNGGRADTERRRRSTLAHELAHTRLHEREMQQRAFVDFNGERHYGSRSRYRIRETEAYQYAAIFLVPRQQLENQEASHLLRDARHYRQQLPSEEIRQAVNSLAAAFHVSPSFMRRCLIDLGWLKKTADYRVFELAWRFSRD